MATLTVMRLTFLEAMRRRIALAAFLLGVAFLVLYGIGLYFIIHRTGLPTGSAAAALLRSQVYNFLALAGMYAVNFLGIALGALVSADTLAGEINSGTIQAIVTKPVRRAEVVLGKWLGFAILLAIYMLLMLGGVVVIVKLMSNYSIPNLAVGLLLVYLESMVIMTFTLACSSRFSAMATGGLVFGLWGFAFIGGFVEQIGSLLHNNVVVQVGIFSSLILPTEAVFRRAAFLMTSPVVQSLGFSNGPLFVVSVPSPLMVLYAALYMTVCLGIALKVFADRDL